MKSHSSFIVPLLSIFFLISACQKVTDFDTALPGEGFIEYIIPKGEQFSDKNIFTNTDYTELKFLVRFDNSAIYKTIDTANQHDINKLYGFADNNEHHQQYSARFGWNWDNGALHLFAYIYNNGIRQSQEIGTVTLNSTNECSIKVDKDKYLFSLNGKMITMPRASTTLTAIGYKLYPYFGGDELAPHTIHIFIKEL